MQEPETNTTESTETVEVDEAAIALQAEITRVAGVCLGVMLDATEGEFDLDVAVQQATQAAADWAISHYTSLVLSFETGQEADYYRINLSRSLGMAMGLWVQDRIQRKEMLRQVELRRQKGILPS